MTAAKKLRRWRIGHLHRQSSCALRFYSGRLRIACVVRAETCPECQQAMNYRGLTLRALILTVCMWPLMRGFAFGDLTQGAVGMPTQQSTYTHGQLLLAKHGDGDSDEDEQGEHKHHQHGRHHD